jgi:hypothetical protein
MPDRVVSRNEFLLCHGRQHAGARSRAQQQCDQPGPAGLVRGAQAAASIAVKIFVEERMVTEVRIVAEQAERRAMAVFVA